MTATTPDPREYEGCALFRSVWHGRLLSDLCSRIEATCQPLEEARRHGGPFAASQLIQARERFVPTASSVTLGAALSAEQLHTLLAALGDSPAGTWIGNQLCPRLACDLDQAWVRRQYAPHRYPPMHAPHGWHQDGALGFDFLGHSDGNFPPDAVLDMVTCWIPLTPCGDDAPGLELLGQRFDRLLPPADLAHARVIERFVPEKFWRPVMEPGDALLFHGDLLHRTHVTPTMTKDRTSLELRFFPSDELPPRLRSDRFTLLAWLRPEGNSLPGHGPANSK